MDQVPAAAAWSGRRTYRAILFAGLILSIVFLPIRFHLLQWVVLALFVLITLSVVRSSIGRTGIPWSPYYVAVGSFTLIYLFWLLVSLGHRNEPGYIFEDSAGFLIYPMFPVLFVFIAQNGFFRHTCSYLIAASVAVAVLHILTFAVFIWVFDELNLLTLSAANFGLSSLGFTWNLGASGGLLRADTKAGHYLLLGIGLLFFRFLSSKKPLPLALIGLLLVGAILDGHRALLVSIAIFFVLVVPIASRAFGLYPTKFIVPVVVACGLAVLAFSALLDVQGWWQRVSVFEDASIQIRAAQIGSLVEKWTEHTVLGNGFGAHAEVIRNEERPFMYEVDFLAVTMKLGMAGASLYIITYLAAIALPLYRKRSVYGYIILSTGLAYFFYMGTNGGFAMSPISSFFHVLLFLCASTALLDEPADEPGGRVIATKAANGAN